MVRYILLFFLGFSTLSINALDSIVWEIKLKELDIAQDTHRLRLLKEYAFDIYKNDSDQGLKWAEEGMQLANNLGDSLNYYEHKLNLGIILTSKNALAEAIDNLHSTHSFFERKNEKKLSCRTLIYLGQAYSIQGVYSKGDSILSLALPILNKLKDPNLRISYLLEKGINRYYDKKFDEAIDFYKEAFEVATEQGNKGKQASILNNWGLIEEEKGNLTPAMECYLKALKIEHNNKVLEGHLLSNLGNLYVDLRDFEKAKEYLDQSLALFKKINNQKGIVYQLNNIAIVYRSKEDYGTALEYYLQAKDIMEKMEGSNTGLRNVLSSIGTVYKNMHQYDKSIAYLKKALSLQKMDSDEYGMCRTLSSLSVTSRHQKKYSTSLNYALECMALAKKLDYTYMKKTCSLVLSNIYVATGDYKQAHKYSQDFYRLKDSISGAKVRNEIDALKLKYGNAEKELQLAKKEEEVKTLNQKDAINKLRMALLGLSTLVLGLLAALLLYYNKNQKIKQAEILQRSQEKMNSILHEKDILHSTVTEQQQQLADYLKHMLKQSEELMGLRSEINQNKDAAGKDFTSNNINEMLSENLKSEKDWKDFQHYFTLVHKDFFKKLNIAYPHLTTYDLNFCALIRLNLNIKEMAQILGISTSSVKKSRQRLYNKMSLSSIDALRSYILQL